MWLNCERAALKRIGESLAVHYSGYVWNERDGNYGVWIGADPKCFICGKALDMGDMANLVSTALTHRECCECPCDLCEAILPANPFLLAHSIITPGDEAAINPATGEIVQLSLFSEVGL